MSEFHQGFISGIVLAVCCRKGEVALRRYDGLKDQNWRKVYTVFRALYKKIGQRRLTFRDLIIVLALIGILATIFILQFTAFR